MESVSKKRKRCQVYDEEEEDEEEKIEKFYMLIKSIREARNRLMKGSDHDNQKEVKQSAVWNPSFQREDFMQVNDDDDERLKKPLVLKLKGGDIDQKEDENIKEELDLTLSL